MGLQGALIKDLVERVVALEKHTAINFKEYSHETRLTEVPTDSGAETATPDPECPAPAAVNRGDVFAANNDHAGEGPGVTAGGVPAEVGVDRPGTGSGESVGDAAGGAQYKYPRAIRRNRGGNSPEADPSYSNSHGHSGGPLD